MMHPMIIICIGIFVGMVGLAIKLRKSCIVAKKVSSASKKFNFLLVLALVLFLVSNVSGTNDIPEPTATVQPIILPAHELQDIQDSIESIFASNDDICWRTSAYEFLTNNSTVIL